MSLGHTVPSCTISCIKRTERFSAVFVNLQNGAFSVSKNLCFSEVLCHKLLFIIIYNIYNKTSK
jgi:hypothetical protein